MPLFFRRTTSNIGSSEHLLRWPSRRQNHSEGAVQRLGLGLTSRCRYLPPLSPRATFISGKWWKTLFRILCRTQTHVAISKSDRTELKSYLFTVWHVWITFFPRIWSQLNLISSSCLIGSLLFVFQFSLHDSCSSYSCCSGELITDSYQEGKNSASNDRYLHSNTATVATPNNITTILSF